MYKYLITSLVFFSCKIESTEKYFDKQNVAIYDYGATNVFNDFINFSGQEWLIKNGCGLGPGGNCWSSDSESVWVDNNDRLHLKVRNIDGVWHSAEVKSKKCVTKGEFWFYVDTPLEFLDPNIVFASFVYLNDYNEIDVIEASRWQNPNNNFNAQYVVQPYYKPENIYKFNIDSSRYTSHGILWEYDNINFESWKKTGRFWWKTHDWNYLGPDIPSTSNPQNCFRVHINLWQVNNSTPYYNQEVEIVVSAVEAPFYR